jgi:hypothetical protein
MKKAINIVMTAIAFVVILFFPMSFIRSRKPQYTEDDTMNNYSLTPKNKILM